MRLGESRGIKKNQFFTEERLLLINGFCRQNGERTNFNKKGSEKNPKFRIVPVPENVWKAVNVYVFENDIKDDDFLFTKNGKVLTAMYLHRIFYGRLKKAKIDTEGRRIVPHSLRYTYVTRMRRNLSTEQVQNLVGHTQPEMTESYTIPKSEQLKEMITEAVMTSADQLFD